MSGFRVALPNPDVVDSSMAKNGLYSCKYTPTFLELCEYTPVCHYISVAFQQEYEQEFKFLQNQLALEEQLPHL